MVDVSLERAKMVGLEIDDKMTINDEHQDAKEDPRNVLPETEGSEEANKTLLSKKDVYRNCDYTGIENNNSLKCKDKKITSIMQNSKSQKQSISLPVTPTKFTPTGMDDPLTPTANLKMLVSAAFSVAGKTEGKEKRNIFQNDDDFQEDSCSTVSDSFEDKENNCENDDIDMQFDYGAGGSRKFKSLGLLCQKFLQRYPDNVEGQEINLHEVAKELQVERRRIYDIVNVLESLEYVTKKGKNTYIWHGSKRLIPTLCKLKALAHKIYNTDGNVTCHANFEDLTGKQSEIKVPQVWLRNGIMVSEQDEHDLNFFSSYKKEEESKKRKNKSLGIFCQKLLMLFIVSKDQTVALEKAAREVIEVTEDPLGKNKTKVRRLYDIANILTSMQLIEKTVVFSGSRKTAFKWIGIDLKTLQPDTETLERTLSGADTYAPTKHSLFCQPTALADFKLGSKSIRKLGARSMSASQLVPRKTKLPRTKSAATISRKRSSAEMLISSNMNGSLAGSMESLCSSNYNEGCEAIESEAQITVECTAKDVCSDAKSPAKSNGIPYDPLSPGEQEFREELRKLHEKFPHKLHKTNGILDLLTASQQDDVSCLKDGNMLELMENGSRCNLMNRMATDEPTAKKSRNIESLNPSCNHDSISQGIKESSASLPNHRNIDSKQAFVVPSEKSLAMLESGGKSLYTSKDNVHILSSTPVLSPGHVTVGKASNNFIQKISVGVQTDPIPPKSNVSPPTVQNGCNITSISSKFAQALTNTRFVNSAIATRPISNQQSQQIRALQSSTLQNLQKKDSLVRMIKIPTSSLNLLPKLFVSEKENVPSLANTVLTKSARNSTLKDNCKTPMPILPKQYNDVTSEETPDRGNIPLNRNAVKTQRKLTTLNTMDS